MALLATVGVVLVAAVVAIGMHYALSCMPWRSTRCAQFSRGARLKVENRQQHAIFWGGLRGPLALTLADHSAAQQLHRTMHASCGTLSYSMYRILIRRCAPSIRSRACDQRLR